MPGLQQIQNMLERLLGTYPMPAHDYFWRGKTRDELVAADVYGVPILKPGHPDESNLLRAMRGDSDGDDDRKRIGIRRLRQIFSDVHVAADDVSILSDWISKNCPEVDQDRTVGTLAAGIELAAASPVVTDDTHVRYWRAIDDFFLPNLASPVTRPHVIRVHSFDDVWTSVLSDNDLPAWQAFLAEPENAESFQYIRHHQRRLIEEFYGSSKDNLLDSMWKFGGNRLPADQQSHARPEHTMNGVGDWFSWSPYLDATLRAPDMTPADLDLARGWQLGIIADGLLRTDGDRPVGRRMPIPDFTADDPDLRSHAFAKYSDASGPTLIADMFRRARDVGVMAPSPTA